MCARRSLPARPATSSRRRPTPTSSRPCARWRGGHYVHPSLGARMVVADAEERKRNEEDPLSDRERDVLRLLALGHTNQEISEKLYISVRTAETHRAHVMQKLRISTRAELVRYALEHGVLDAELPLGDQSERVFGHEHRYQLLYARDPRVVAHGRGRRQRCSGQERRAPGSGRARRRGRSSPRRDRRQTRSTSEATLAAGAPRKPLTSVPALPVVTSSSA